MDHGFGFQLFERTVLQLLEGVCKLSSQQPIQKSVKIHVHPWLGLQGPLVAAPLRCEHP